MRIVSRVALILNALGEAPEGMTVSELAERLDEPVSSLHRLLQALVQERIVWQDGRDKRYSLSTNLLQLTQVLLRDQRLRQVGRPYLERLGTETGETAFLAAWIQDRAIIVDAVEAHEGPSISLSVPALHIAPFHCASSGKAILAYQPPESIDELLEGYTFTRFTEHTITDPDALRAHLATIREQGYAVCAEEAEVGITALACPIFNAHGEARASIGLCARTPRFEGKFWNQTLAALRQVAERISVEWGGYRRFVVT